MPVILKQHLISLCLYAFVLTLQPGFSNELWTENAVKNDDSTKHAGTQIKSYEQRTSSHRSLRTAADHMLTAARKDKTQSTAGQLTAFRKHKLENKVQRQHVDVQNKNTRRVTTSRQIDR